MGREDVNPTAAVSRRRSFSVLPGRNHQVIGLVSKSLWLWRNCSYLQRLNVFSKSLLRISENGEDEKACDSMILNIY